MVWGNGMVGPEHFGYNSLNGAGTSLWVLNGFLQLTVRNAGEERARWKVGEGVPRWKMGEPRGCVGTLGVLPIDGRQSSAEAPIGTGADAGDGARCGNHEESRTAAASAPRSSMTINRPSLQIGQPCGSSTRVVLPSESLGRGGGEVASRARH